MKTLGKSRGAAALATAFVLAIAPPATAQTAPKPAAASAPAAKPVTATKPAPAGPTAAKPADAKGLLASGEKKFKANDYQGALADYEASETAKASPDAERGIALANDNLKNYAAAVTAYEKFLAGDIPAKMKPQADEAKTRVEAIKAMPGKLHIETVPAGASVVLDGAATPYPTTTPIDMELPPGKHTLKIGAEGYDNIDREVDITFASESKFSYELPKKEAPPPPPPVEAPPPAPPPPPPPPPEPRSKIPAFVTGGVAIVAAGVGTGFGIKALQQSSDFKDSPTTKRADDGENNALVADMMFGIAITFGVTSAVLFLSSDSPASAKANGPTKTASAPKPKKSVTVIPAPYVTPHGGGAGALVSF